MTLIDFNNLELVCKTLKRDMLKTIRVAKTGHTGSCCSSLELMSVLYFSDILRIDSNNPKHPDRDLILVRGFLGPLRYNIFKLLGWLKPNEMDLYRQYGSRLSGHENMNITPGVDITPSGSLGMILSYAVGARYSFNRRNLDNRIFCFLGDGESQEGNIDEAARHASNLNSQGLINGNIIVIIDRNRKQLSTATKYTDSRVNLSEIWKGYGWEVIEIENGHNINDIYNAYNRAIELISDEKLVCIIANTVKGNGIRGCRESYNGYHVFHDTVEDDIRSNRAPISETIDELNQDIGDNMPKISTRTLPKYTKMNKEVVKLTINPSLRNITSDSFSYLEEFLYGLSKSEMNENIYILTADYPPRRLVCEGGKFKFSNLYYCNVGIREQHLLAMTHGISTVDENAKILILCGEAFVYRFADQLNVLAQSQDDVTIYAMQSGISGSRNGFTHQPSSQPGMILTMPNIDFYEPASKLDWFYAMNKCLNDSGVKYVRNHRLVTSDDIGNFTNAPYYIVDDQTSPDCTIISNGMLMGEVIKAINRLLDDGIKCRLINVVEPKKVDGISRVVANDKPVFVIYNGNPDILSFPLSKDIAKNNMRVSKLITRGYLIGKTGYVKDLYRHFGLGSNGIYNMIIDNLT